MSGITLKDISAESTCAEDPSAKVTVAFASPQKFLLPNSRKAGVPVTAIETGLTSSTTVTLEGMRYAFFISK